MHAKKRHRRTGDTTDGALVFITPMNAAHHPLIDALVEFLRVAVHLVLYTRRVYPPEIFERRRYLDVAVFRSRHAKLNEYIDLAVDGARDLLLRGEANSFVLIILGAPAAGGPSVVLERFRFELVWVDRAASASAAASAELAAQLRGFLLKLHVCDTLLVKLPTAHSLSFELELHSTPARAAEPLPQRLRDNFEEREELGADEGAAAAGGANGGGGGGGGSSRAVRCVPLKSLNLEGLALQLVVLEHPRGPSTS